MIKQIDYKVPGGKLIRITTDLEDDLLLDIKITGDFFLHPEEKIEEIENSLRGRKLEESELREALEQVIKENSIQLIGVSARDFIDALMKLKS